MHMQRWTTPQPMQQLQPNKRLTAKGLPSGRPFFLTEPRPIDMMEGHERCAQFVKEGDIMHKRVMDFKMERENLLHEGDHITVTEGVLPSNYYYTIDPSLAMSGNYPFRERMLAREGVVTKVIENARGFYVTAEFEDED